MAAGARAADLEPVQYHMSGKALYASDDDDWPQSPGQTKVPDYDGRPYVFPSKFPLPQLDDNYFDSMPSSPPPPPDPLEIIDRHLAGRRRSTSYAEGALRHYNADPNNRVKYELVEAGLGNGILTICGLYGHVNFVAGPRAEHGGAESSPPPERLFFAEVRMRIGGAWVPTCLRSLDSEDDRVGGVRDQLWPLSFGVHYCISCGDAVKHPKDGTCYKAGHMYPLP